MPAPDAGTGWAWFEPPEAPAGSLDQACRSAAACLGSAAGQALLAHLRRCFLERRVPPAASDAELRHVEGQRSVVHHLLQLVERGRRGVGPIQPSTPATGDPR